jgi:CRP-like cAMP-binding protein
LEDVTLDNPVDLDPKEYVSVLSLLKQIDFLAAVPETELKNILFSLQKQDFGPGKTILFQGEIANRLFIIRKGSVAITTRNKGQKITLAQLNAPHYFGEISLLTPTSATATVTALDDGADLIILTHDALSAISKKIPDIQTRIQHVIDSRVASKQKAKDADDAGAPKTDPK